MGASSVSLYRGYGIQTVVTHGSSRTGDFVGYVAVDLAGEVVGRGNTGNFAKFMFAEVAAYQLGQTIIDALLK